MANTNNAYDFDLFKPKEKQKPSQPELTLIKQKNPGAKARKKARPVRAVLVCALTVAVIFFALYNRALLTEVSDDISSTEKQITELQNRNDTLRMELEGLMSVENIEEYATEELGLVKIGEHQTQYVTLSKGDKVEIEVQQKGGLESFFDSIGGFFSGLMEYLNLS